MLIDKIKELGFDGVSVIDVSDVPFEPSLIKLCEMNSCGNYGKCYTCPPHVGKTQELIEKARGYKKIAVMQKIYKTADSFDIEGMRESSNNFASLMQNVNAATRQELGGMIVLGAGGCRLCGVCGVIDGVPCRYPDKALASLESYGIFVSKLAEVCGMNYINGQNTVTYFGGVLFQ